VPCSWINGVFGDSECEEAGEREKIQVEEYFAENQHGCRAIPLGNSKNKELTAPVPAYNDEQWISNMISFC
jgi:hypothetical protein